MRPTPLLLAVCLLAVAASGASAQSIWKWRDGKGQMHIGDTPPPPGTPAKDITQTPAGAALAPPPPPVAAASGAADDLQKKKLQADADKAAQDKAKKAALDQQNADARAQNCRAGQQQAATMQSGQRIARIAANGEREYLDDAQRNAELKKAQTIQSQYCGAASAPN